MANHTADISKKLVWSILLALTGAIASIIANRVAARIWWHMYDEEPPE